MKVPVTFYINTETNHRTVDPHKVVRELPPRAKKLFRTLQLAITI
jgi:hypothetical protein